MHCGKWLHFVFKHQNKYCTGSKESGCLRWLNGKRNTHQICLKIWKKWAKNHDHYMVGNNRKISTCSFKIQTLSYIFIQSASFKKKHCKCNLKWLPLSSLHLKCFLSSFRKLSVFNILHYRDILKSKVPNAIHVSSLTCIQLQ